MRSFKSSFLVIGLVAVLSWPIVSLAQYQSGGIILGHLIDAQGHHLKTMQKYVSIFAYQKGQWLEGPIDDDGQYEISNIPAGDWFVGAHVDEHSGFVTSKIDAPISINNNLVIKDITLNVLDGVISGKILGSDGNATGPALVSLTDLATGEITARETDNGFYSFFVKSGNYVVNALSALTGDGSSQEEQSAIKKGQLANIALVFAKGTRKISGTVTPDGSGVSVYAWSDKGNRSQIQTNAQGKFTLVVNDQDVWYLTAVKPTDGFAQVSEETSVTVQGLDVVQDLVLTKKITLPKIKSQQFTSDKPATITLDDGMTLSFPAKSVPSDKFTVTIRPAIGPKQKGIQLLSNFYEATLLDAQGKQITNLLKRAIVQIPYAQIKQNSFNENFLRIFYWNPDLSAWQSNSNSAVDLKSKSVIGLTNYLAGYVVTNPNPPPPPPPGGVQQFFTGSAGSGSGAGLVVAPQLPTAPSVVNATALSDQSINVAAVDFTISKNEKYHLERSLSLDTSGFSEIAKDLITPVFVDTKLNPSTFYYYRFFSVDDVGTGTPSVTAFAQTFKDQTPPTISNVNISFGNTNTEITFTTNELTTSELKFGVNNLTESSRQQPNLVTVHDYLIANSDLGQNVVYQYQIKASDANGNTTVGPILNFTTPGLFSQIVRNIISQSASTSSPATVPVSVLTPFLTPQLTPLTGKSLILRNLRFGDQGSDVKTLQEFLISQGFLSAGLNSGFFGNLTFQAVVKFQEKNAVSLLAPFGLSQGTGFVGNLSRDFINKIIQSQ